MGCCYCPFDLKEQIPTEYKQEKEIRCSTIAETSRVSESLCFRSASPAEALSRFMWLASPLCDSPPVWLLRSFQKTHFMWPVISSAVLLQWHNIYSELLGQLDHYVYSHAPSQKWVRHVFAHPRKLCLECNSTVIVSVASLALDFVYRRRGVLCNSAKNCKLCST